MEFLKEGRQERKKEGLTKIQAFGGSIEPFVEHQVCESRLFCILSNRDLGKRLQLGKMADRQRFTYFTPSANACKG